MLLHIMNNGYALRLGTLSLFSLVLLAIMTPPNIFAQTDIQLNTQEMDGLISETVHKNNIPGLAAAIIQDDEVVLEKGYGQDITPQTQFYIGSITKSFTALAVMQLVEQGELDLDTPVQEYLPWFELADESASSQITIRNLLNHTSGLGEADDSGSGSYSPTLREQIENMDQVELTAPIGTHYQYSNQNYRILSLVVEEVSGRDFSDYLEENIFTPLGMSNSTARIEDANNLVQGHGQILGFPLARQEEFQPAGIGSGYIISTAEDMARYMQMMLNHGTLGDVSLISEASWNQMTTPPEDIESIYAMGWIRNEINDSELIYHGGSLANYTAFAAVLPEENAAFVFLSNQNGVIPMFTVFDSLKRNMIDYVAHGTTTSRSSFAWLFWALRILLVTTVGLHIYRISRLSRWARNIDKKKSWKKWLDITVNLFVPLVLLLIPLLAKTFFGASSASWGDAFRMAPDVVIWIMVLIVSNLFIGIGQVWLNFENGQPKEQVRA